MWANVGEKHRHPITSVALQGNSQTIPICIFALPLLEVFLLPLSLALYFSFSSLCYLRIKYSRETSANRNG